MSTWKDEIWVFGDKRRHQELICLKTKTCVFLSRITTLMHPACSTQVPPPPLNVPDIFLLWTRPTWTVSCCILHVWRAKSGECPDPVVCENILCIWFLLKCDGCHSKVWVRDGLINRSSLRRALHPPGWWSVYCSLSILSVSYLILCWPVSQEAKCGKIHIDSFKMVFVFMKLWLHHTWRWINMEIFLWQRRKDANSEILGKRENFTAFQSSMASLLRVRQIWRHRPSAVCGRLNVWCLVGWS